MAGNKQGSIKAVKTIYKKYGKDYFKTVGKEGGKARTPNKGFGADRERARVDGAKGGSVSKRTWTLEQRLEHSLLMRKYWRKDEDLN